MYNKLKKKLFSLYFRLSVVICQKTFITKNGTKIHYIEKFKGENKKLVVVFSGFAAPHQKARYNYMRTLKDNDCNLLFILDDFGFENVGSYYLGEQCRLYEENGIIQLVDFVFKKSNSSEMIFAGSSKGGSAALIYGLQMDANKIIIGSPQYRIGDYLMKNDYHKSILSKIITNKYDVEWLNNIIDEKINNSAVHSGEIILVYSSKEENYLDLEQLVNSLSCFKSKLVLHDEKFENHADIGKYFSNYLKKL